MSETSKGHEGRWEGIGCSESRRSEKVIVDPIHGAIPLTHREVEVVDTPTFQRLRGLKQLAMAQSVYPNATHTRFAHSIGALGMMARILDAAKSNNVDVPPQQEEDLRLAALLHDVGHYPYSHLMERIDRVTLTEQMVEGAGPVRKLIDAEQTDYPDHEEIGQLVVTCQDDLVSAIGGPKRAKAVADIFTRTKAAEPQLSKLIHSSFDIDRWDYLARDSHAAGVPYGHIDVNYLLNNLKVSRQKVVGFSHKALPALEHFLLARFFMHRVVYYHKTIFGIEEACRQLLRRLRDRCAHDYDIPPDGKQVRELVKSKQLYAFTDAFVDQIIQKAAACEPDPVAKALAKCIQSRKPPILLKEVVVYEESDREHHAGTAFLQKCRSDLKKLSDEYDIPVGQFLLCAPTVTLVKVPREYSATEVAKLTTDEVTARAHQEEEEQIRIFLDDEEEPRSLTDIKHSLVKRWGRFFVQACRLYVVFGGSSEDDVVANLRDSVKDWGKA